MKKYNMWPPTHNIYHSIYSPFLKIPPNELAAKMICRIVINKMNKTKSSKLTHRSNHPMRILFKMRANHYGAMRTLEDESRT
jgi:hypothetical protein